VMRSVAEGTSVDSDLLVSVPVALLLVVVVEGACVLAEDVPLDDRVEDIRVDEVEVVDICSLAAETCW
jgi:hypothetical protein